VALAVPALAALALVSTVWVGLHAYEILAVGLRAGTRLSDDRGGVRRAAPVGVRHRLPDAGQRERGGARGAGGVPAPPPGARGRRADRVAARLPVDGGLAALARPPPLREGAARDLRR